MEIKIIKILFCSLILATFTLSPASSNAPNNNTLPVYKNSATDTCDKSHTSELSTLGRIVVAEATRIKRKGSTKKELPRANSTSKTYYLKLRGETRFRRFGAGRTSSIIEGDCVKIDCPASFGTNTVCWECKKRSKLRLNLRFRSKQALIGSSDAHHSRHTTVNQIESQVQENSTVPLRQNSKSAMSRIDDYLNLWPFKLRRAFRVCKGL